jgi:pimeloyl-ACP methyl ester carboxylesterase
VPRVTIAFDNAGAGPPLVLLHGTGSRRGVWDPVIAAVSQHRRTLALDAVAAVLLAGSSVHVAEAARLTG